MRYTLWMHEQELGDTTLELSAPGRRRAGIFRPTEFGLTVLPRITDKCPALLAFGELSSREGIDVDDDRPDGASAALDSFGGTAEGQRVIHAATHIASVVVKDSLGELVHWESLAVTDLELLAGLSQKQNPGKHAAVAFLPGIRKYVVSLTMAASSDRGLPGAEHLGAQRGEPAPH
jgi:hypothetical protein